MTFTYTPDFTVERDLIRFHIQDTVSTTPKFTDEEIAGILSVEGSWQKSVIALLEALITRIASVPDFKADWLQVSSQSAIAGLEKLIERKRRELGVTALVGSVVHTYRPDSAQTGVPTYPDPSLDEDSF